MAPAANLDVAVGGFAGTGTDTIQHYADSTTIPHAGVLASCSGRFQRYQNVAALYGTGNVTVNGPVVSRSTDRQWRWSSPVRWSCAPMVDANDVPTIRWTVKTISNRRSVKAACGLISGNHQILTTVE